MRNGITFGACFHLKIKADSGMKLNGKKFIITRVMNNVVVTGDKIYSAPLDKDGYACMKIEAGMTIMCEFEMTDEGFDVFGWNY